MPTLPAVVLVAFLCACGSDPEGGATPVASDEANRDGTCAFNRECPADQRCACSEADGCACADGPRGTGRVGVDTCTTGDDCASSLCVESNETAASGGVFYCSDECETHADCAGALPVCMDVVYVGRVCVRDGA